MRTTNLRSKLHLEKTDSGNKPPPSGPSPDGTGKDSLGPSLLTRVTTSDKNRGPGATVIFRTETSPEV